MRPIGAGVHLRKRHGQPQARRLDGARLGPVAFFGAYLLHVMGNAKSAQDKHRARARCRAAARVPPRWSCATSSIAAPGRAAARIVHELVARPLPTVLIGHSAGIIVGMTSVGSGSLMIVLLLFLYPTIGANQLVGTDLTQAVPLTAAAALGALAFGHIEFGVTVSLIIGSVPAVLVGSLISSSVPDRYVRPVITFVVFASGLKYVGVDTDSPRLDPMRRPARRRHRLAEHHNTLEQARPAKRASGACAGRANACAGGATGAWAERATGASAGQVIRACAGRASGARNRPSGQPRRGLKRSSSITTKGLCAA